MWREGLGEPASSERRGSGNLSFTHSIELAKSILDFTSPKSGYDRSLYQRRYAD